MYLSHFGLDEPPFRITPHTDFFFDGANRGATLEALLYAITHDEGIVKVSGEVGSGKTMLCRVLMERLPKNVDTIYLSNPSLARDEILLAIAEELKVNVSASRSALVLRALQDHLVKVYADGRQVVVLIDEAHAMPLETLEEIRLLSNLESSRHKLLQIVLFGQPELDDNLNIPQMRQLKERITHSFRLEPLIRDDIAQYLMFRMRAAGYRGPDIFSPAAIRSLTKASQGLTRRINILADKSLLAAFSQNTHQITAKHVRAAIRDSEFHHAAQRTRMAWIVAVAVVAGVVIGGVGLRLIGSDAPVSRPLRPSAVTLPPAATTADKLAAPVESAPATPSPAPAAAAIPVTVPATVPAATSVVTAVPATAPPVIAPATETPAGDAKIHAVVAAKPPGPAHAAEPDIAGSTTAGGTWPLIQHRMEATAVWLKEAPGGAFAIQVMTLAPGNERELEAFLTRAEKLTGLNDIYLYQTRVKGQSKRGLAVVYGSYPTRDKVREAIAGFPEELRSHLPYLRTVDGIRREIAERDLQTEHSG
jgi:type II secretory pathway predicted ATPase ExeA/septal ring-binding cell division protein DamX